MWGSKGEKDRGFRLETSETEGRKGILADWERHLKRGTQSIAVL